VRAVKEYNGVLLDGGFCSNRPPPFLAPDDCEPSRSSGPVSISLLNLVIALLIAMCDCTVPSMSVLSRTGVAVHHRAPQDPHPPKTNLLADGPVHACDDVDIPMRVLLMSAATTNESPKGKGKGAPNFTVTL
jgi:hypothetical protein